MDHQHYTLHTCNVQHMCQLLTFISCMQYLCKNEERKLEDRRRGHKEVKIMSVAIASALLHLPKDFKKEFNGTIGYSWLGTRRIIQWGTRPQENSIREQIENMCLWGPSLQHKPNPSMILAPLANRDQMQESLNTSSNNNSKNWQELWSAEIFDVCASDSHQVFILIRNTGADNS